MHNVLGYHYGIITDNQDPDGLGRVKASLPMIGDDIETNWLPLLTPYGSNQAGMFFLPEIEDPVYIAFFDESMEAGIVLGSFYSQTVPPPESGENSAADFNDDGNNNLHFIKSRSGQRIIIDDTDGEEKIQILNPDGATRFEFLGGEEIINIETDKDLSITAGGKIKIESEEIEITAEKVISFQGENISAEADKNIEITAGQNVTLEGQSIKLN